MAPSLETLQTMEHITVGLAGVFVVAAIVLWSVVIYNVYLEGRS
jgi:hypothetical protein